ncbi:MAG TPA: transglutaminase-like domain-containing protein [Isosphaeraceae bacterium]|jgi:transglutaminase-like putative cysteine protease|nr:transglutaminase-like domain-containing protein [Isosphaeraceae bacterium]
MVRSSRLVSGLRVFAGFLAVLSLAGSAVAQEAWDSVYIGGVKAGYIRLRVEPLSDKGRELIRVRYDLVLKLKRDKDQVTIQQQWGTLEKPDGEVLKLETRTLAGQEDMRSYGEVDHDKMTLVLSSGGQKQQVTIPWGVDVRGPYAAELSLSRQPIKPGETREVKTFLPELKKVCTTALFAKQVEDIVLGGGQTRSLLRIESKVSDPDGKTLPGMDTTYWIDDGGQILKSFTDAFGGMETYRTTREAAVDLSNPAKLDLLRSTILRVKSKIPQPDQTRNIVYRVTMKGDEPAKIFPEDERQKVKSTGDVHSVILEVRTASRNQGAQGPEEVSAEYLRSNVFVDTEDPKVKELTRKAVGNLNDPWQKAAAIEKWVHKNIRDKNFGVTFASSREVARNLKGDCTEHSVLTAAMCRVAGIPTRMAVGVVYAEPLGGFGFHMWNEVYIDRRWVAIDSTFDETEVDATHIKLLETSLDGASPTGTFLPVVSVSNKTTLEPIEIR